MKRMNTNEFILLIILIIAFMLRITGITFPVHHFDENISMTVLLRMLQNNSLNPHYFIYPQQPWFYLNFIVYKIYTFCVFCLHGSITLSTTKYYNYIISNLHSYYVLSRLISVLFSTLSVYLIYQVAQLLTKNKPASYVAAITLALAPLPNYFCKYFVRIEEMAIPFVLLISYLLLKYIDNKETKYLYFCAILAGLVTSIKWPFAIITLPLFVILTREKSFKQIDLKYYRLCLALLCVFASLFLVFALFYSVNLESNIKPLANKMINSKLLPQHQAYIIVNNDKTILVQKSLNSILYSIQKYLLLLPVLLTAIAIYFAMNKYLALKTLGVIFNRTTISLIVVCFASFVVFSPFVVLSPFLVLYEISRQWWGDNNFINSFIWYLSNTLNYGIGNIILSLLSLSGLIAVMLSKELNTSKKIALTLFPATYFLYLCVPGLRWDRWMLPIIPFQAIYIAFLFNIILSNKNKAPIAVALKSLTALLLICGLYGSLKTSIANDYLFTHFDQHKMEKIWIKND